jgi:F-box protein 2
LHRGGAMGAGKEGLRTPEADLSSPTQISHTFTDYGPGVRFVRFEHGGQDSVYWKGWFGARVTNSSVWVEP